MIQLSIYLLLGGRVHGGERGCAVLVSEVLQPRQVVRQGRLLHGARPAERRVQPRPAPAHAPVPAAEAEGEHG